MHWIFIVVAGLAVSCILGISVVIYLVSQPTPATQVAMKQVQELSNSVVMQKKFNDMDRADIAVARVQLIEMIRLQDSVQRRHDSIFFRAMQQLHKAKPVK